MRISEIDLQCEDIMWFGADESGHLLAFTSGGNGNVPEFVCRDRSENEELEKFFLEELDCSSKCQFAESLEGSSLVEDAQLLSQKGLFVYDVTFEENHENDYSLISCPGTPLTLDRLPHNIIDILKDHVIGGASAGDEFIHVTHAY